MSLEPRQGPETPRTGKYCPRCHTMAPRDLPVCRQCGHQFRSSADSPAPAKTADPDPLNRTMQFVLPPLRPHPAPSAAPPGLSAHFDISPRRLLAAGAAALLLCVGAFFLWQSQRPPALPETPAGTWETTLHGKASANARLEFQLRAGGTGQFSWRESGPAALSGRTPLRWTQNPDGTLALSLTPPATGDAVSQTLAGIFSSRAWAWHIDPSPRRLHLGTLVFTEKQ